MIDGETPGVQGCTSQPADELPRWCNMTVAHFRLLLWLSVDGDCHKVVVHMLHYDHP